MFATTVVITEYLTAYMLYTHFRSSRMAYLAALASASVFVAIMAAVQVLIFRRVFGDGPARCRRAKRGVDLDVLARRLSVLRVAGAAVADAGGGAAPRRRPVWLGACRTAVAAGAAITLATLAVADGGQLPPLIDGAA